MTPHVPVLWTDERVEETVDSQYIQSHLRPDEQQRLKHSPSFGAGLTDDTYLDWILARAKRFFLILVAAGVPDQIFGIVDDSYDDDDLPVSEDVVPDLRLSYEPNRSIDKRFYKTQFRYLTRIINDGEHIRYAQEEAVPVYPIERLKTAVMHLGKDGTDKVRLPLGSTFTRKRIALDDRVTEHSILAQIASAKNYAHQHLVSVYGSYLLDESVYILLTPAVEYNLRSFLSDVPKSFDTLPKQERRRILINWPHCLADALAWLHANGRPHGAVRPSNVLIDDKFCISLGSFDDAGVLDITAKVDDVEAYQYAAPERWKRAVTMQSTGPAKTLGHSGGRTARKVTAKSQSSDRTESTRSSWSTDRKLDTTAPTSTGYAFMPTSKSNFTRLQLGRSDGSSFVSVGSERSLQTRQSDHGSTGTVRPAASRGPRPDTPSALSFATISSGGSRTNKAAFTNSVFVVGPEVRTAVIQTWQSAQFDLFAADMFSLGAVILGILTLLCKRSAGSFERHRSTRNRTPGRGGGLADASFHANIGQVEQWANILREEAKKKAKKEDRSPFRAVGPILQLTIRCLERDPERRLSAHDLEKRSEECISSLANVGPLHCQRMVNSEEHLLTLERPNGNLQPSESSPAELIPTTVSIDEIARATPREDQWSMLRSKGLMTATIPLPGIESSFSSLASFNFDYDVNSETIVEDDRSHVTTEPSPGLQSRPITAGVRELARRFKDRSERAETWNNWHNNDSAVDPRLSQSPPSAPRGFNYMSYSSSFSSEDDGIGKRSFFLPESRLAPMARAPPPNSPLPPLPQHKDASREDRGSIGPEAFPAVPRRAASREQTVKRQPPTPDPDLKPEGLNLQRPGQLQSGVVRDDEWQSRSQSNSPLPHRPRPAQSQGRSYMQNI